MYDGYFLIGSRPETIGFTINAGQSSKIQGLGQG